MQQAVFDDEMFFSPYLAWILQYRIYLSIVYNLKYCFCDTQVRVSSNIIYLYMEKY